MLFARVPPGGTRSVLQHVRKWSRTLRKVSHEPPVDIAALKNYFRGVFSVGKGESCTVDVVSIAAGYLPGIIV